MTLLNFQLTEWGNPQCYLGSWLTYTKSEFNQLEVKRIWAILMKHYGSLFNQDLNVH